MSETLPFPEFPLRASMLTFTVEAQTPIEMGAFKGSALRGAWKAYLQAAYCTAPPAARQEPLHQQTCPVCYLTEYERGPESRRPYALRPPLTSKTRFEPGERFAFGLTLLGNARVLLPYVLLAVREMGAYQGLGRRGNGDPRRGLFRLVEVQAAHPLQARAEVVLAEESRQVQVPSLLVTAEDVQAAADRLAEALPAKGALRLRLLTPMRLIDQGRLVRRFAFGPFYRRLLERLFMLAEFFGEPPLTETKACLADAVHAVTSVLEQVRVVADQTRWWDLHGYSSRLQKKQPLGGLVGEVTLEAPREVWHTLLVPLLWGQITHVGKNTVKGQGWYEVLLPGTDSA